MNKYSSAPKCGASGFSLIELLVVIVIIFILSSISLFMMTGHQTLYKPDEQTVLITDMLQEARQRALTQVEVIRVEINRDANTASLYDENLPGSAADDVLIRTIFLLPPTEVTVGVNPSDIAYNPDEGVFPVPTALFVPSVYPPSITQSVCTLRYLINGTVANAGNDAMANGAVASGATIHVWAPNKAIPAESSIARSITVIGVTGSIRAWEFNSSSVDPNKWKDSRRTGTY